MKFFALKLSLIAGILAGYLIAAAPAGAHTSETVQSGTWVRAFKDYCWDVCRNASRLPVIAGHYSNTNLVEDQHYLVCRIRRTPVSALSGRPGFNISTSKNRCRTDGGSGIGVLALDYDCLCQ